MVYTHAYLNILLLLHSAFMLFVVKLQLKGAVLGRALKSYGNCIIDHEKSWKNHGIVFLNFYWNPGNTLSWNAHIDTITKKANNTTAFLRRNLSTCPKEVKDACYKTFVRPQVNYAATVWDPHTTENIKKVAVLRRAARFVTGDYHFTSSVTAMTESLS